MEYFIYVLLKDGVAFYIGVTKNPSGRLSQHKSNYGAEITMEIKDRYIGTKSTAILLENFWIQKYSDMGIKLKNKNSETNIIRRCKQCFEEITQIQGKRVKLFCNNTCRSNYWYAKNKKRQPVQWASQTQDSRPKLPSNFVADEPLSFEKLKQVLAVNPPRSDYETQLHAAECSEDLQKVGREIERSTLSRFEKQRLQAIGQAIFNEKFNF